VSRRIATATSAELTTLASEGFTSLILAAPALEPTSVLKKLLPLLAPSAPFAVWSYAAQPLAEALEVGLCTLNQVDP
jgi:tRNA (adenine-N(1)-)-methyltransferase non-catalytic subunit